jgi:type I restriction enzyme R subunit
MQEMFRRRHLPHWDLPGATYFVTACLAGSIPAQGLLNIRILEKQLIAGRSKGNVAAKAIEWKKLFVERERWLDGKHAVTYLQQPQLAKVVADALKFYQDDRYKLIAWVVMPSHFHWLFRPLDAWAASLPPERSARQVIMQTIKSVTAHRCNELLNRTGAMWQQESFDHCVRDEEELERILDYIEHNPVKAGLCRIREDWPFSSAHDRHLGQKLCPSAFKT